MHRDRITLLLLSATLSLGAVVSCTSSENVNDTGKAGSNGGAGTTGAAGDTSGAAGTTSGAAGTTSGAAGTTSGAAGTTSGAAGTTSGAAGTTSGAAGTTSGAAGTTSGAAGSTGAAGSGTDAGAGGSTGATISFATNIYPFIMTQCMPCHTKATGQDGGPLDMSTSMKAYTSLLGTATPPTGHAAMTDTGCKLLDTKKLRVEPGDPTHSYLYIKVSNTDAQLSAQNCGPSMPKTGSNLTLTTDQKTMIQSWIMGGALP